jgi:opacity protein-like surface antigen
MKKMLAMIATAVTLALPTVAQANEGFYAGVLAGVNFMELGRHHNHHGTGESGNNNRRSHKTDTGWTAGVEVGYKTCNDFRLEFEASYRSNQIKRHHNHHETGVLESTGHHNKKHHARLWSFMFNGYYDLNLCWCVEPYVGVGIGYDHLKRDHNNNRRHNNPPKDVVVGADNLESSSSRRHHHRNEGSFAWQVMAGINYDLNFCGCDEWQASLEYKFHHGKSRNYDNSVTLGLRKYF